MRLLLQHIRRSGTAPLTIQFTYYNSIYKPVVIDPECTSRLSTLELTGRRLPILKLLHELKACELPVLRRLRIVPDAGLRFSSTRAKIPDSILRRAPRLCALFLSYFKVSWTLLGNLDTLCGDTDITEIPTFTHLLPTLGMLTGLKHLELARIIPPIPIQRQAPQISLPLLECLALYDNLESCRTLLANVILAPSTRLRLHASDITSENWMAAILVSVRLHVRTPPAPVLKLLQIRCSLADYGETLDSLAISGHTVPFDDDTPIHLGTKPRSDDSHRQIVTEVLRAIPCDSITHLDTRYASQRTSTGSWKAAPSFLPHLEMLYLHLSNAAVLVIEVLFEMLEERLAPSPISRISLVACFNVREEEQYTSARLYAVLLRFLQE
ncbi:hypothetical protein C8J57DRAFT_1507048 [Mycena rebaudengoi]|nr:hypothetical protein C8J57DRAFT_1507048 [Mycena rebaudengoi]